MVKPQLYTHTHIHHASQIIQQRKQEQDNAWQERLHHQIHVQDVRPWWPPPDIRTGRAWSPPPLRQINIYTNNKMINLTELGIFISSILLSVAGCLSVICTESRRSKCTKIKFPCCVIDRDTIGDDDIV